VVRSERNEVKPRFSTVRKLAVALRIESSGLLDPQ
jgi:hypothetical protein